jgi:membrane protein
MDDRPDACEKKIYALPEQKPFNDLHVTFPRSSFIKLPRAAPRRYVNRGNPPPEAGINLSVRHFRAAIESKNNHLTFLPQFHGVSIMSFALRKNSDGRGREARRPGEIPARGWRDIVMRVKDELAADNISIVAAGVAYYIFLALFPGLAATVSIYGFVMDPATLQKHVQAGATGNRLGWAALAGALLALWSAAKGMSSLMEALNIVYDEKEQRGFIRRNATALLLTLAFIVFLLVFLGIIAGVPAVLSSLNVDDTVVRIVGYLRWPLLAVAQIVALAVLYRYAASRAEPKWRWITPGAIIATILWLAGSAAFSLYVSYFASYNKTYGALGVVVILLTWLLLSVYSVLLGAEINAEMEHQTKQDTTEGRGKPMGQRRAHVADTVGRGPDQPAEAHH